jgi:hypothetical protein
MRAMVVLTRTGAGILGLVGALALGGCRGSDEPSGDVQATTETQPAPPPTSAPAEGAPAPAAQPQAAVPGAAPAVVAPPPGQKLTLEHAEQVGFVRGARKEFKMIDAVDGAGGTINGSEVELYVYEGEVPQQQVENFRSLSGPNSSFGWLGVCVVRNLMMLYREEAACDALKQLQ